MIFLSPDAATDIERVRDFLDINNPEAAKRALRTIFAALEHVQEFPELGRPTQDPHIRQIVIRFGAAGYVLRDTILPESNDILVLRLWHGREARTGLVLGLKDNMTPELQTAVAAAYSVFAAYRVRRDLDFAARVSASDAEHARLRRTLAETPLRELPADAIDAYFEYIDAAHYDGGFRADEVRHFLPRALETIARREARPWLRERIERLLERGEAATR